MTIELFKLQCRISKDAVTGETLWTHPGAPESPLNEKAIQELLDAWHRLRIKPPGSDQVDRVASAITNIIPDGMGFIVFTFPLGDEPGLLRYASNANREDCINVLKEFMIKGGHAEDWMKHV